MKTLGRVLFFLVLAGPRGLASWLAFHDQMTPHSDGVLLSTMHIITHGLTRARGVSPRSERALTGAAAHDTD